jgi:hypothetical protein
MRKTTKLHLILFPVSVLMLVFCVSVARASNQSFVIGSMQEAEENVYLGVSDSVVGNLSVMNGSHIDFFIDNPDGITVQGFLNVSNVNFNLVVDKNGTYSMRLNNTYQVFDVTVELDYGASITVNAQVGVNVGSSSGVAHVVAPLPPTRPLKPDDDEPTDYLVKPYLNFLRAADLLKMATEARTILPIRNVTLMSCIASGLVLTIVIGMREREPDARKHMRSIRHLVESGKGTSWKKQY